MREISISEGKFEVKICSFFYEFTLNLKRPSCYFLLIYFSVVLHLHSFSIGHEYLVKHKGTKCKKKCITFFMLFISCLISGNSYAVFLSGWKGAGIVVFGHRRIRSQSGVKFRTFLVKNILDSFCE